MTDEERARRGEEARRLLNEPLLVEAFESIERAALDDLLRVPADGDVLRRCLTERMRVVRSLRAELETIIAIGAQAAKEEPGIY